MAVPLAFLVRQTLLTAGNWGSDPEQRGQFLEHSVYSERVLAVCSPPLATEERHSADRSGHDVTGLSVALFFVSG